MRLRSGFCARACASNSLRHGRIAIRAPNNARVALTRKITEWDTVPERYANVVIAPRRSHRADTTNDASCSRANVRGWTAAKVKLCSPNVVIHRRIHIEHLIYADGDGARSGCKSVRVLRPRRC